MHSGAYIPPVPLSGREASNSVSITFNPMWLNEDYSAACGLCAQPVTRDRAFLPRIGLIHETCKKGEIVCLEDHRAES